MSRKVGAFQGLERTSAPPAHRDKTAMNGAQLPDSDWFGINELATCLLGDEHVVDSKTRLGLRKLRPFYVGLCAIDRMTQVSEWAIADEPTK